MLDEKQVVPREYHPADCGQSSVRLFDKSRENYPMGLARCDSCGLVWARHGADIENRLDSLPFKYSTYLSDLAASQESVKRKDHDRRLATIRGFGFAPRGRLLDIGCGNGNFVERAIHAGFDAYGIEPDETLAEWAERRGLPVQRATTSSTTHPARHFDVITLHHVLEHVRDPLELLAGARRLLRPDGLLVVEVPNAGSILAKALGRRWRNYKVDHLLYFGPDTLRHVLRRAGFEPIKTERVARTFRFDYAANTIRTMFPKLGNIAFRAIAGHRVGAITLSLPMPDIVAIYARNQPTDLSRAAK